MLNEFHVNQPGQWKLAVFIDWIYHFIMKSAYGQWWKHIKSKAKIIPEKRPSVLWVMFRCDQLLNHILFNIGILPCVPYTSTSQIVITSFFVNLITLPTVPGGQGKCLVSPFPIGVLPIFPHVECCVPFSASMMRSWSKFPVSNTKLSEHQFRYSGMRR